MKMFRLGIKKSFSPKIISFNTTNQYNDILPKMHETLLFL